MHLLMLHLATVFGGAERTTSNLITHLDRGVVRRITLAAPAALRDLVPPDYDDFIDTAVHLSRGWFTNTRELRDDARVIGTLIARAQPDLVLGMMHYPSALAVLGRRLARLPVKTVGSFRGPVYEHMRLYEHGRKRHLFLRLAVGATARLADRMIVPSEGTARELSRRFLGPARRTVVVPNGIDGASVARLAAEPAPGLEALPPDLPRLCTAARLSPEKNLGLLLAAFRRLQSIHPAALVLIGDGPDRAALERQVVDWGLADRVCFLGHCENVYPYIRQADLYVHTCQFEGFGYTMLEALACGTPVVATDCPYGPREVLGSNEYGLLTPMDDAESLARAISMLLTDPERRCRLTEHGLERAGQLSIERMVRGYEHVFTDVMKRG
ncbi:glycosyltransferase [Allochromatium palmeri]|uniref:Glycosyltransferase n=1 Tax=Allochromatium palmeri TaxID=231048 RepID=A0A6N8EB48_9GAMM|nr:glycosyltransferase [Allochromatium palmeri]MTW19564.1 glycosyltransferase [Allochromatium palmeri]